MNKLLLVYCKLLVDVLLICRSCMPLVGGVQFNPLSVDVYPPKFISSLESFLLQWKKAAKLRLP